MRLFDSVIFEHSVFSGFILKMPLSMFRRFIFIGLCVLQALALKAQCPFDAVITPSSLSLCPLDSDTLFAGPATSYQWFRNSIPLVNSNQSFWVVNAQNDAGASFLVVQTLNGCSEASAPVTVSVIPTPPVTFAVDGTVDGFLCAGQTATLSISSVHSSSVSWFRNGIQVTGANSPTLTVSQGGTYSVTAAVAQCPNIVQFSGTESIQLVTPVVPVISANLDQELLLATGNANSYIWQLNGEPIAGASTAQLSPTQTGVYTVTAIYNGGCSATSANFVFEGFNDPCTFVAQISTPNGNSLCQGDSLLLSVNGESNFQWFSDGQAIEGANSAQFLLPSELVATVVTASATEGICADVSEPISINLVFPIYPVIATEGGLTEICEGGTLTLSIESGYTVQNWLLDGNPVGSNGLSLAASQAGSYSVEVFGEACPDQLLLTEPVNIGLAPNPQPVLSLNGSSLSTSTQAESYQWYLDGNLVPGLSGATILAQNGVWEVQVTYANGCSATSEPFTVESIGWSLPELRSMLVKPNPSEGVLWVDSPGGRMRLFDVLGRIHFEAEVERGWMLLPVRPESGHYLLMVENSRGHWQQKVVFR